jgi:hypothetical protein
MSRDSDDLMDLAKTTAPEPDEDLEDLALGEDYALNPEFVPMVADALDRGDTERLRELLSALHPADIADLMGFLSAEDRRELVPIARERAGGWAPGRTVVIGDAPGDVECALAGGAIAVALLGHFGHHELEGAHAFIERLTDLGEALAGLPGE